ncbi:hypothetical protein C2S52_001906 [Perilla frutescens var. hirtella]|nr:hypothetical protein C2S52_001906 [Perilla frutescens var. hirtella]
MSVSIKTGKIVGNCLGESMYRAALEGNWVAAELLLEQDPNLARDYVTEEGDRALHVATAMKCEEFVQKLVERSSTSMSDLELPDGRGYTACCYAAISGAIEIARVMIEKNPNLITAHDKNNETPLHKAAFQGNKKIVSYFLKCSKVEDLSNKEWFDLLLVTIRGRMYEMAIEILGKNKSIATMANEQGTTALHLLARQAIISNRRSDSTLSLVDCIWLNVTAILPDMRYDWDGDFNKLAGKLWAEMQKLGKSRLLELIKEPHNILHDAAKEGHVRLVTMLIRSYPQLITDTDSNGYTIFHIAAKYRHIRLFNLIYQIYPMIDLRTLISHDKSGDNILHLAAKLAPPNKMKLRPVLVMQNELLWFKAAEEILPPCCMMMRNKDELRPRDLFSKEHSTLLKNSETWMRNTADSYMLIATILLTVVFAAAFTVPGGYDPHTGEPIHAKKHWFKVFLVFEVLGLIFSVFSIVKFRSIMASRFAEEDFVFELEEEWSGAFPFLLFSLVCAFAAFMSAVSLFNMKMNGLVWFGFCTLYVSGALWSFAESITILREKDDQRSSIRSTSHIIFN